MVCCYCNDSADNCAMDSKIRCNGQCNQFIHITCVNLSKTALKSFADCAEMHFYCRLCQKYSLMGISDTMDNFSREINNLSDALKPLSKVDFKALTSAFITNKVHPNVTIRSTPKRQRTEIEHPPQIGSEKIGTKDSESLTAIPKPKSLVVARLANSTTVEKVVKYITDNASTVTATDINCTILIPKDMKPEDLKHINFRVTVPDKVYDQIFDASFWPKGVHLRQYIFRQRKQPDPVFL